MAGISYMEMIYIDSDGNARHTNVRAAFATNAETWAQFQECRSLEVPKGEADFLLDYYNAKGDLAGTILLNARGFEFISNEKAKTDEEYRQIDAEYWKEARANRDKASAEVRP